MRELRLDRIGRSMVRAYLGGEGFAGDVPGGVVGFVQPEGMDTPDLQFLLTAAPFTARPWLKPWRQPFQDSFAVRTVLLHPRSRGRITVAGADPLAAPRIDQNFLACQEDREQVRDSVRIARDLMRQPALGDFVLDELALRRASKTTRRWTHSSAARPSPCTTRAAPAAWARSAIRWRWWTGACAAWAFRGCASSMRRSCPT